MVDLTRRTKARTDQARLLDLVPGRSGRADARLAEGPRRSFTSGVKVATLDPFRGYRNAVGDELEDAAAVLDAFHVRARHRQASMRSAAGSSRNSSATGAAITTRSTGSATAPSRRREAHRTPVGPPRAGLDARPEHEEVTRLVRRAEAPPGLPAPQAGRGPEDRRAADRFAADVSGPRVARLGRTLSSGARRCWPTSTPTAQATGAPRR